MINITNNSSYPANVIHEMLSRHSQSAVGVSTGDYGTVLHLDDNATASEQNRAQKIFDNWDNLNPSIDKTTMDVGDADPVVTYDTGDSQIGYVVTLDGQIYASDTETVVSGTATLELESPEAGEYIIYIYRLQANLASGSVSLTVNEV